MAVNRTIYKRGPQVVVADLLQSALIGELWNPSPKIYIVSAWLSNTAIVDNRGRAFSWLCPSWPATKIKLAKVLTTLMERGSELFIVTNTDRHNEIFVEAIKTLNQGNTDKLHIRKAAIGHRKVFCSKNFLIRGGMNFTYNGLFVNDEHIDYSTDTEAIAMATLEHDDFYWSESK